MEDHVKFEERIIIRVFKKEYDELYKILHHARTDEGFRKYDNISHLVRCAIMKLIREEKPKIKIKKGRPKKY
jgi:hypothetical protein